MNPDDIQHLLQQLCDGEKNVQQALNELRNFPVRDLGFARVDTHRPLRQGHAEVIYCEGKTPAQIAAIIEALRESDLPILATRASAEAYETAHAIMPDLQYDAMARCIYHIPQQAEAQSETGLVTVVCAGTSDLPVAEEAARTAQVLGSQVQRISDVGVAGLHRLLNECEDLQRANVIIAVAGMEGALPSVVGGLVACPVIAVPTSVGYGAAFGGLAALLGMLNSCASNVTVVGIDSGFKAAYVANCIDRMACEAAGG